jgi:putative transposase
LLDLRSTYELAEAHRFWVEEALRDGTKLRESKWTESVAVGSEVFVTATKEKLGFNARGREVIGADGSYELKLSPAPYKDILGHENDVLRPENTYFWDDDP